VADVFKGWILGLQTQGIETGAFNLDARLNFFGAATIKQDDGEYQKAFNGDHAAEIAIEGLFADSERLLCTTSGNENDTRPRH
jgi:hypothetical protein